MAKPAWIYLVGAARKIWRWSEERKLVKKRAEIDKEHYRCSGCKKTVVKIEIDHVNPIGRAPREWKGWDEYYQALFCSDKNLAALCRSCHREKTKKERLQGKYK